MWQINAYNFHPLCSINPKRKSALAKMVVTVVTIPMYTAGCEIAKESRGERKRNDRTTSRGKSQPSHQPPTHTYMSLSRFYLPGFPGKVPALPSLFHTCSAWLELGLSREYFPSPRARRYRCCY